MYSYSIQCQPHCSSRIPVWLIAGALIGKILKPAIFGAARLPRGGATDCSYFYSLVPFNGHRRLSPRKTSFEPCAVLPRPLRWNWVTLQRDNKRFIIALNMLLQTVEKRYSYFKAFLLRRNNHVPRRLRAVSQRLNNFKGWLAKIIIT